MPHILPPSSRVSNCSAIWSPIPDPATNTTQWLCIGVVSVDGLCIYEAGIIPSCLGALLLGVYVFLFFIRNRASYKNSETFGTAYLTFGVMMSTGAVSHCVSYLFDQQTQILWELAVCVLTSTVAFILGLSALVDVGLLTDGGLLTRALVILSPIALYFAYIYGFTYDADDTFFYLYTMMTVVCCGAFALVSLRRAIIEESVQSAVWLFFAVLSGAAGLYAAVEAYAWFCAHFNPLYGGQFWWYNLSVLSMFCLFKFYAAIHHDKPSSDGYSSLNTVP